MINKVVSELPQMKKYPGRFMFMGKTYKSLQEYQNALSQHLNLLEKPSNEEEKLRVKYGYNPNSWEHEPKPASWETNINN